MKNPELEPLLGALERSVVERAIKVQGTPAPAEPRERMRHLHMQDGTAAFAAGVLWATTSIRDGRWPS